MILAVLLTVVPAGHPAAAVAEPQVQARAWTVIDAEDGKTLLSGRASVRLPMASTTKLMTAWVALHRLPLRRRVPAVDYHGDPSESLMGLRPGEMISVRDLLCGLILRSGNDAAATLAVATSGSVGRFVTEMNRAAVRMGLTDTSYTNPVGLDARRHFTTATDLAVLARKLMRIPEFRRIAGKRQTTLASLDPPRTIETSDTFLKRYRWATGIKTGHTLKSGYSLVSSGHRHATDLIAVVIGAPTMAARDLVSARLLRDGFRQYRRTVAIQTGRATIRIPIRYGGKRTLPLVSRRKVVLGVRTGQRMRVKVDAPATVEGPVRRGQRLGVARVLLDGRQIARVGLRAGARVEAPSWFDRLRGAPPLLVAGALLLGAFGILAATVYGRRRHRVNTQRRLRRAVRRRP